MAYDDIDNDGRFLDDSRVEVRYPRSRQEEHGDRAAWPWLPGSIVEQCGPDEWRVCVEDRGVAVLRDGRPAPRNTAPRNLYYPLCFRGFHRDPPARASGARAQRAGAARGCHPGRAQDHGAGGAQGAVAVTGHPDLPRPDAASSSHSALNCYGELVHRQWQGCLPDVYQQVRDPGVFFAVLGEVIAQRIDELADHLAGDDPPGEGYLAKVARLTAARDHAKGRVLGEYLLLPPDEDRPVIVDRGHPSWAEIDAEQRERLGDPLSEEGRP